MAFGQQARRHFKRFFEGIGNERLRLNLLQAIPFWVASLLSGLAAVLFTKLFAYAEGMRSFLFHQHNWVFFFLTPVGFIISWWLVVRWAPFSRGSGIPQVMAAIELANPKQNELVDKLLSFRIIVFKMLSSLVMVFAGGGIGREGPTIQIAGSIFRKINQWLPAWWPKISKRNMIMAGAAAGLAAAFNTPLGGVVFAVEELTRTHFRYFKTALFSAVIIAGLTAQGMLGPYLYLGYPVINSLSNLIFLGVVAVALVAGMAGSFMSKAILGINKWKSSFRFNWQHLLFLISCGWTIAILANLVNEEVLGSGRGLMTRVLFTGNKYSPVDIPLLRMLGPVLSFTSGAAGGIFAPALSAGAAIGSFASKLFSLSDSNTNLLILSGMVGFLTGVTRTPFTSAILVLEMTDRHNVIFHLLLAGLSANLIALAVDRHSLYDHLKFQYIRDLRKEEQSPEPLAPADEEGGPE
jgi:H+/Cl- antiporter ClcA